MKKLFLVLGIAAITFSCHKNTNTSKNQPAEDVLKEEVITQQTISEKEQQSAEMTKKGTETEETKEADKKEEIKWMSYDEAVKEAKKKPKKIFINAYTDWCGWCKKMEKTTLKDPKIAEYMNKKFYPVKLNAEGNKELTYQGKKMTEKQLAGKVFNITGYPTTVYLEANETLIQPIPGFMDVTNLDKIMHYIGEDYYKTQSWEQFQMSYK